MIDTEFKSSISDTISVPYLYVWYIGDTKYCRYLHRCSQRPILQLRVIIGKLSQPKLAVLPYWPLTFTLQSEQRRFVTVFRFEYRISVWRGAPKTHGRHIYSSRGLHQNLHFNVSSNVQNFKAVLEICSSFTDFKRRSQGVSWGGQAYLDSKSWPPQRTWPPVQPMAAVIWNALPTSKSLGLAGQGATFGVKTILGWGQSGLTRWQLLLKSLFVYITYNPGVIE